MADELNTAFGASGLTVVARIYDHAWVQQGADIACAEIGVATGLYTGSVPAALLITNQYAVLFYSTGPDQLQDKGVLSWDGVVDQEIINTVDMYSFVVGGRNIDFIGNDALGWQKIENNIDGAEVRRYNLFDQDGNRINETVDAFIDRRGMISIEVPV